MSEPIIKVEGLSKRYILGHQAAQERYQSLREALSRTLRSTLRTTRDMLSGRQLIQGDDPEEFWALKDVSFEVCKGEILGVIGRNGAGKSTLLKILSRITEPTSGRVTIHGRVASLLEVGTGFHPELSGRENIYLNGAILGMSRTEIRSKFEQIVSFAEVERFIDTPVKRYSSGMYVRLAFAVAAHLEPEILIIDEVLAVGDIAFQKRCLGKINDIARNGRTIIFVSHDIAAVRKLTVNALYLERGSVKMKARTEEVTTAYLKPQSGDQNSPEPIANYRRPYRNEGVLEIVGVTINGQPFGHVQLMIGEKLCIRIHLHISKEVESGLASINILDSELRVVSSILSSDVGYYLNAKVGGRTINLSLDQLSLAPGIYFLSLGFNQTVSTLGWDVVENLPGFTIDGSNNKAWMMRPDRPGSMLIQAANWSE